jgi:hypothetical protein
MDEHLRKGRIGYTSRISAVFSMVPQTEVSRLIESLLLGIPIPQIFVAQLSDGIWDVVDGLQRLSTIFEFAGILLNDKGNKVAPLALEATTYLPQPGNPALGEPKASSAGLEYRSATAD